MAELGADYSWARPGGARLVQAGVKGVGRYLAAPGDGRAIEKPEYDDLTAHGLYVWFVREGAASGMLAGHARGVADAQVAVANLARLGLSGQVVHAAADWDVQTGQFAACDDYMRGFASVLGVNRVGIYGGLHYLNHAHASGLAVSFWRAGATSWDHGEAPQMQVNFQQTTLTPPVTGTDHNFIFTPTPLEDDMTTPEDRQALINELLNYPAFTGGPSLSEVLVEAHTVYQAVTRKVSREVPGPAGAPVGVELEQIQDNADTNTMVRALLSKAGLPAPVDVEALATAIAAKLPTSVTPATASDVTAAVTAGLSTLKLAATS